MIVAIPEIGENLAAVKDKAIEIVTPESLEINQKQVVQTSKAELQDERKADANFAGEFDQRVEKETQAPLKGKFKEGLAFAPKEPLELNEKGIGESGKDTEKNLKNILSLGSSPHALAKDIPMGNQTVLNTDKVRYASFVNRIADEIYQPWVEAAERVIRDFSLDKKSLEANLYVTRLRITLDAEGLVTGIQILDSSGVNELDEAPKKAFWEAESFPNPPKQLFDDDGYVRLTYEFQFEWKNSSFNVIPWKI